LRKVSICTLNDLNPGFGKPWNKLWIFFVYGNLKMPQKKSFGKTKLNFMHGFKSAILAIFSFCQNGTFEPVHEIHNYFWPKDFFEALGKCHIQKISITCSRVRQIQDPRFPSLHHPQHSRPSSPQWVQLNKYETAPYCFPLNQNLTWDCLLISYFLPEFA
jgi:hypothetical protein